MAYRGPLQQDVCMREQAELRRLETGAPGSTELRIECDSVGVNVGIVGGSALPSESGGGAESLLLVQPDAVLANTSDTLVDGTALGPYVGGLEPVLGGGPMATGDDVIAAVRVAKKQKRKAMLLSKWYCPYCKTYTDRALTICSNSKCAVPMQTGTVVVEAERKRLKVTLDHCA